MITVPALIALAPLIGLLAALVRMKLGSPVLFRQERPGQFGKPFTIYKFRTLTEARDAENNLLPDGMRLTSFGRKLRASSLDELPELFNVLRGQMSLVGPRPLLVKYLPFYTERENLRHQVKPGITGWVQINGRNLLPWDERLTLDVWYVEHCSLMLDLRTMFLTLIAIFKRDGFVADPRSLMLDFDEERSAANRSRAGERAADF